MNTETTIQSFETHLRPFLEATQMQKNWIILDGARCHTSKTTLQWMNKSGLKFIPFGGAPVKAPGGYPPASPDCNAIGKIFGVLDGKVVKRSPSTVVELVKVVEEEWRKISLDVVQNAIAGVHEELQGIRNLNGGFQPHY